MNTKKVVERIIAEVEKRGDRALIRMALKFDKVRLTPRTLRVSAQEMKSAQQRVSGVRLKAIRSCSRQIAQFHREEKKHLPQSWSIHKKGVRFGQIYSPVESVGLYIPGGRFSYPSTLLMTAIPAQLAGVKRIVVVTPSGRLSPEILVAAQVAGVKEIYRIGGAAAIAALALGTKTVPKVDLIVGPGNAFVTEAKRQLFGRVGIDLLAGPSELVVIADRSAKPAYVAADMAAQAEHDPDSQAILISLSAKLIREVQRILPKQLQEQCEFVEVPSIKDAANLANKWAGEHVEIMLKHPQTILPQLKHGGAIFLNSLTPAVMGDYWAGPSHVLPTGRSARFASGLSVLTFIKRSSVIEVSRSAFKRGGPSAQTMAEMEGLSRHAQAVSLRLANN